MTNAFIQMSGVFAELELRIIRERVRSGMRNARAKGARIGRPQTTLDDIPANFLRHYPAYKNGAFNLTELARLCDISRTTAYKVYWAVREPKRAGLFCSLPIFFTVPAIVFSSRQTLPA